MNTPINEAVELADFTQWWNEHGQFCRAGGGSYEETFAWRAWQARAVLPPPIVEPVAWIGPHANAWEALNETRKAVADIIGADRDTWPDHGNAPLSIAAVIAIRQNTIERAESTPASAPSDGAADARVLDPVVEANRALLHERSQVGIKKYGVTLGDANLSEPELLTHALQELLDGANYIQALLMRKTPSPEWEALMQRQDAAIASTHTTTGGENA